MARSQKGLLNLRDHLAYEQFRAAIPWHFKITSGRRQMRVHGPPHQRSTSVKDDPTNTKEVLVFRQVEY